MPKKGLLSLKPEWLSKEKARHEKRLAELKSRCECLEDEKYLKTPAIIRAIADLKESICFEMEMIMEIETVL